MPPRPPAPAGALRRRRNLTPGKPSSTPGPASGREFRTANPYMARRGTPGVKITECPPGARPAPGAGEGGGASRPKAGDAGCPAPGTPAAAGSVLPLPWSVVETMDILADAGLRRDLEESLADMRAGRVVPWVRKNAQNAASA